MRAMIIFLQVLGLYTLFFMTSLTEAAPPKIPPPSAFNNTKNEEYGRQQGLKATEAFSRKAQTTKTVQGNEKLKAVTKGLNRDQQPDRKDSKRALIGVIKRWMGPSQKHQSLNEKRLQQDRTRRSTS